MFRFPFLAALLPLFLYALLPIACNDNPTSAPIRYLPTPTSVCYPLTCTPTITFSPTQTPTLTPSLTPCGYPGNTCTPNPTNSGYVSTLAGSAGVSGFYNAQGTNATFNYPEGAAADSSGNVYIADWANHAIRKIALGGQVSTLAGNGLSGSEDGKGVSASFDYPSGVAVDLSGNVYVADTYNQLIRKINSGGQVSTLAGVAGVSGHTNGQGATATFNYPVGIAVDSSGNVYVADTSNQLIREITSGGVVSTLAGKGTSGSANGPATAATFYNPQGIAVDSSGNVYVADTYNNMIREITPGGTVSTLAGSVTAGFNNATGSAAKFHSPVGIAVDLYGVVYVADSFNNMIRQIAPGGAVSTLAGTGSGGSGNGPGTSATFYNPEGVAVDPSRIVYVGDTDNDLVRMIQ